MNIKKLLTLTILIIVPFFISGCNKDGDDAAIQHYKTGKGYLYQGKNQKALDYLNKSLEINPDIADSYISRATAYIELKEYDKAKQDLEFVISKNYSQYESDAANYVMFILYAKQKKRKEAFESLKKAFASKGRFFRENPLNLSLGFIELYGTSLLNEERFEDAHEVFLKATEYSPDEYKNYAILAMIEEKHYKNSTKALKYLKKAKKLSNGKITEQPEVTLNRIKKI